MGHDMAVFTIQAAVLHQRHIARSTSSSGTSLPRIYLISADIEHAFNSTWRDLVEYLEWKKFKIQGTIWSLARSASGGAKYYL